jgi:hypothetical protein
MDSHFHFDDPLNLARSNHRVSEGCLIQTFSCCEVEENMNETALIERLVELVDKIDAMQKKLDFLMQEIKLEYPEETPSEPDPVLNLLKAGRKINAIELDVEKQGSI